MSKKAINILLFVLSGIPLLAYPFILIANIMQLAADPSGSDGFTSFIVYLFVFLSTTYIFTYLVSLIVFLVRKNKQNLFSLIPIVHLVLTLIVFFIWMSLS